MIKQKATVQRGRAFKNHLNRNKFYVFSDVDKKDTSAEKA